MSGARKLPGQALCRGRTCADMPNLIRIPSHVCNTVVAGYEVPATVRSPAIGARTQRAHKRLWHVVGPAAALLSVRAVIHEEDTR